MILFVEQKNGERKHKKCRYFLINRQQGRAEALVDFGHSEARSVVQANCQALLDQPTRRTSFLTNRRKQAIAQEGMWLRLLHLRPRQWLRGGANTGATFPARVRQLLQRRAATCLPIEFASCLDT